MRNYDKAPSEWSEDIRRSVQQYNDWFTAEAPRFWSEARDRAGEAVANLMYQTADLRALKPECLVEPSDLLTVLRACTAPPLAKERLATLADVRLSTINRLHNGVGLPRSWNRHEIQRLMTHIDQMLDPVVFPWVTEGRAPTELERDEALLVVGDRTGMTFYNPLVRNAQEARQVELIRDYLHRNGYTEISSGSGISMPDRTFQIHRGVPYKNESGEVVGLPVDCVANPGDGRAVALIEMKSAGDFTNVNKRRKEEASKAEGVRKEHGDAAVFLLQLFGYFNHGYCSYEANAGIDWAWDHRLRDFDIYLA